MGKNNSYNFLETLDDILDLIKKLPPVPTLEWLKDWQEFVIEKAIGHTAAREFYHTLTKLRVRFDPKTEGAPGFRGKDHWHIRNPNAKNKRNLYLDENGNPVMKDSDESHIIPKKDGDE